MKDFDVIVVGAGHAGIEAAMAGANLGRRVLVLCINLDSVGFLACNPSIGGNAKAHLTCEIDALGGIQGIIADKTAIQIRMLNTGKGAAVQSLRAQVDKVDYHNFAKKMLEDNSLVTLKQGEVISILKPMGVKLSTGEEYFAPSVVIATGTYLDSAVLMGQHKEKSGPNGYAYASELSKSLSELGLNLRRFKTGTPPRVNGRTIYYSVTKPQGGDDNIQSFSFMTKKPIKNLVSCHLTYTNKNTHQIIRDNLHTSAMYSGLIEGVGPRYCPSIEDKIVRFSEKERHQLFLEPESLHTNEVYLQGLSSSLPPSVQEQFVHSIAGLENTQIMRNAYAIEYDCIDPMQLTHNLECKEIKGLFFAGQVNGTSGYEEAAAQGLIAGINAAGVNFTLDRTNSYIGVLIDDLVTQGCSDPYRMLTSRAEHRLYLRQDNADIRLTPLGRKIGLVCDKRWRLFNKKLKQIKNPATASSAVLQHIEIEKKYAGYITKEKRLIAEALKQEQTLLPADIDYATIKGLRLEARQKLNQVRPINIGQAGRISGVTPADITVLLIWLRQHQK